MAAHRRAVTFAALLFVLLGAAAHAAISLSGPSLVSVQQGQQVSAAIQLSKSGGGKPEAATFTVTGLPSGMSAKFAPASCKPSCTTTLTVATQPTLAAGDYLITIRAQTPNASAFRNMTVRVTAIPGGGEVATFYVSTTGNDTTGDGSIGTPWATIGKFHTSAANAGDVLNMRGGSYNVSAAIVLTKDGSAGNLITIQNYQGEQVIIDGNAMPGSGLIESRHPISLQSANYWHIKGIEITNGPEGGGGLILFNTSSNNIIELNKFYRNAGSGMNAIGTGVSNNLVLNNDSYFNEDAAQGNADGFSLGNAGGAGNVARGNRAWRNSDDGFDFFSTGTGGGVWLIEDNWAWENGLLEGGSPSSGNGNGLKVGGSSSGSTGGHTVQNNVSWRNEAHGFDQNGANIGQFIYNNTAWDNGQGAGSNYNFSYVASPVNTMRNNISHGTGGTSLHAGVVHDHNSWDSAVTVSNADFQSLVFTAADDARQSDGSLPNLTFLKLVAGSDLIDAGTNVGIGFNGSAPDMGAYEFGGDVAPTVGAALFNGVSPRMGLGVRPVGAIAIPD